VAQKLHDQYGYSYDNLKVLLGGWHAWQNANYPSVTATPGGPTATPAAGASDPQIQITVVASPKP
jgi:hypothetical protein